MRRGRWLEPRPPFVSQRFPSPAGPSALDIYAEQSHILSKDQTERESAVRYIELGVAISSSSAFVVEAMRVWKRERRVRQRRPTDDQYVLPRRVNRNEYQG